MANFNSIVSNLICKPVIKQNGVEHVLFTRVDGTYELQDGESIRLDNKFAKEAKGKDNSPDNLRRLFITYKGVYTQYHRGLGGNDSKLISEKSYPKEIVEALSYKARIMKHIGKVVCYPDMLKQAHNGIQMENKPKLEDFKGFGVGALVGKWVFQNIEEIYIDWTLFTCYGKGGLKDIRNYGNNVGEGLLNLLIEELGVNDLNGLLKRFPRLHTFGLIADLENMYEKNKGLIVQESDIEERLKPWIGKVLEKSGKQLPGGQVNKIGDNYIIRVRKANNWMLNYSSKVNIYKFDNEILERHFISLTEKYHKKYVKNYRNLEYTEDVVEKEPNELENKFNCIESSFGRVTASNLLITELVAGNIKDTEWEEFTDDFKSRYLKVYNGFNGKKGGN